MTRRLDSRSRRGTSISDAGFALILLLAALLPARGSAQLVEQWTNYRHGRPEAIASDAEGNIIVAGTTTSIDTGRDLYVAKYSAIDGALLWERSHSSSGARYDSLAGMAVDAEGNVAITGGLNLSNTNSDIYIARYAADDGALLWEKQLDGPASSYELASGIAIDASGNVIIAGAKVGIGTGDDWYTAKFAATDGALIWERLETGPSPFDTPWRVAIDSAGNVLVTGVLHEPGDHPGPTDIYTVKYAAADGALLWAVRYGSSTTDEFAFAIALDSAGNVIIAGNTGADDYTSNGDLYTAKYAAGNGEVLWEKIYNGPSNGTDYANAVAVDPDDNVLVTGKSVAPGSQDLYTAKYAAASGALLWEKRYHGSSGFGEGRAIKTDTDGNAMVAAVTFDYYYNIYLARYAAADGALLWEFRYTPPIRITNFIDAVEAFTLTPDGGAAVTGYVSTTTSQNILTLKLAPYIDADADGLPDPWELSHWGTTAAHSAQDDTDSDGLPELLEYAFSLDPRLSDRTFQPQPVREGVYLTLTLNRRAGLTYTAESTGNLTGWSNASTTVLIDTPGTFKVRDNVPTSAGGSRFLRMKISAP